MLCGGQVDDVEDHQVPGTRCQVVCHLVRSPNSEGLAEKSGTGISYANRAICFASVKVPIL